MNRFLLLFLLLFMCTFLRGQVLQGIVLDHEGNPIPFSTVFIKELNMGAVANEKGRFSVQLQEGEYQCTFQSIGYKKITQTIQVNKNSVPVKIILRSVVYALESVTITPSGEDPAYPIMRHVIGQSPYYANMINLYKAEVYIRGSINVAKISKAVKFLARKEIKESGIEEGKTYMEESLNEIDFKSPNIFKHKVKSIQTTIPKGNSHSEESLIFLTANLYKNERGAKSPLVPGAFSYYTYIYQGAVEQGNKNILKIKVVPKGSGSAYYSGYIYIVDGLWCLAAVDLSINGAFNSTLKINQTYGEVKENAWAPVGNRLIAYIKALGNEVHAAYTASVKYKLLEINFKKENLSNTEKNADIPKRHQFSKYTLVQVEKLDKKIKELSEEKNLTTRQASSLAKAQIKKYELLRKDSLRYNHEYIETYKQEKSPQANEPNSVNWEHIRPAPLDSAEIAGLHKKKQMQVIDSVENKEKKRWGIFSPKTIFWGGKLFSDSLSSIRTDGIISFFGLGFNAVDAFTYKTRFEGKHKLGRSGNLKWYIVPGYAFGRKIPFGELYIAFERLTTNTYRIALKGGTGSADYNPQAALDIENTYSSLLLKQNISRLYFRDYAEVYGSVDLSHEFSLHCSIGIENNTVTDNQTNYSFYYKWKNYKPNIPDSATFVMNNHKNITTELMLFYKPMPYYYIKDGKRMPRLEFYHTPTLFVAWRKGIPAAPFTANYNLLRTGIWQKIYTYDHAIFNYSAEIGYFVNVKRIYFNAYKHFAVQTLHIGLKSFDNVFQNTQYYTHSTNQWYAEAHTQYSSKMLLLKHLPIIRNRLWTETLMLNYLYTPNHYHYAEIGYGIGNELWEAGLFVSMHNSKFHTINFKLSLPLFERRKFVARL